MVAPLLRFDPELAEVPRQLTLCVIAQDPSVKIGGSILRAEAHIPYETLQPGPRGIRFQVVDFDSTNRKVRRPVRLDLDDDRIATASNEDLANDAGVRAQNVYTVAARTLDAWEMALGRRLAWSFGSHQLYLVPAAFEDADAFYDPDSQAILFGFFSATDPARDGAVVYTALSHDVVAHETTHAILDGMRRRFEEPGLPDQAAFHEALADIVAMLSVFSLPEVVERLLGPVDAEGRIPAANLEPEVLAEHALFGLAEEVGTASEAQRGTALRRSIKLEPSPDLLADRLYEEPHARGEILVAAVVGTLLKMWTRRLAALVHAGLTVDAGRAAEEGSKSADHLLRMCIRAIDYTPPLDFAYADFLAAILASDAEIAPDDQHGYRDSLIASFGAFGIVAPPLTRVSARSGRRGLSYSNLHVEELRTSADEVYRFLWENAKFLELPTKYYLRVEDVQPCTRLGPDGFVVREVVATYTQILEGSVGELEALASAQHAKLEVPPGLLATTKLQLLGGGALIFDEFGRLKYHHRKPLFDWDRQGRRLAYLVRNGLRDSRGRFGFSLGTPLGQRFALMHEPGDPTERW